MQIKDALSRGANCGKFATILGAKTFMSFSASGSLYKILSTSVQHKEEKRES